MSLLAKVKNLFIGSNANVLTPQQIKDNNPKFDDFTALTTKDDKLYLHSVTNFDNDIKEVMNYVSQHSEGMVYAKLPDDKISRLRFYRQMARFPEIGEAIKEIINSIICFDENGECVNLKYNQKYNKLLNKVRQAEVTESWNEYVSLFNFKHNGKKYFKQLVVEGELAWEHIIDEKHKDLGIIGLNNIRPETFELMFTPGFKKVGLLVNAMIDYATLQDRINNPLGQPADGIPQGILNIYNQKERQKCYKPLPMEQVTYICTDDYDETQTIVYPVLEQARIPYRQLALIEDAIIIYRLVRAPERLIFNVDVGGVHPSRVEEIMLNMQKKYMAKKVWNPDAKTAESSYDPHQMLESYWFARPKDSPGTTVSKLDGGQHLGELNDLNYFQQKLYVSLQIPYNRWNKPDVQIDSKTERITGEELRFAEFLMNIHQYFSKGLFDGFKVHLKLKGLWDQYELCDDMFNVEFVQPVLFRLYVQQQLLNIKMDNYDKVVKDHDEMSIEMAQALYLGWTDEQISINKNRRRKERIEKANLDRIVKNIESSGKPFSDDEDVAPANAGGAGGPTDIGGGGMGGPDLGGSSGPTDIGGGSAGGEVDMYGMGAAEPAPPEASDTGGETETPAAEAPESLT